MSDRFQLQLPECGFRASDPQAAILIEAIGGVHNGGVTYTLDQWNSLAECYGYNIGGDCALENAGASSNLAKYVQADGGRVMAFLADFLEKGQDPVKLVARLCIEAGYDVNVDADWVYSEDSGAHARR